MALRHPGKRALVTIPKVASTTLDNALPRLMGLAVPEDNVCRARKRDDSFPRAFAEAGFSAHKAKGAELAALVRAHGGYHWATCCPNPYDRVMSAWGNKLHPAIQAVRPALFVRAKLGHLLTGPRAWRQSDYYEAILRRHVGPDAFVDILARRSIAFNRHDQTQADLAGADKAGTGSVLRRP